MNWSDIFNPWGALRRARAELSEARDLLVWERSQVRAARSEANILRSFGERDKDHIAQLKRENGALKRDIAKAHFRNPATGRLGRRGERF